MKSICSLLILLVGLCMSMEKASAGVIGPVCGSCEGGVYTLTFTNFHTVGPNDILDVTLNFNTDTYTGGGLYIDAAAVKIAPSIVSAILISAPPSAPVGSAWNTFNGALNANGCSGAGSGFICSESNGNGAVVSTDILNAAVSNTFVWQFTIASGTLFDGVNEASIKGLFTDANGTKAGAVLSENITLTQYSGDDPGVPEPGTYALIGGGLAAVALLRRAKN